MDSKQQPHSKDINAVTAQAFSQMSAWEKVRHVGKVIVFLLTFGFVYPNIFSD